MKLISIVSRELIKPSSQTHHLKPYNLCLIDQLVPKVYYPVNIFYPISEPKLFDLSKTLTRMKTSLSETLNLYYPFSGRTKNNLYVDDFHKGVPFFETKVKCEMSQFIQNETELHNKLVPIQPYAKTLNNDVDPPIAFQLNVFPCGGIALGISLNHKIMDGATLSNFLKSWAAFSTGSTHKVINPNLFDASTILFPPKETDFINKYSLIMDRWFIKDGYYTSKKFVFTNETIQTLIEMVKSECMPKPTRNTAITCFILKHIMPTFWAKSPHDIVTARQAVNIRPRMKSLHHNGESLDGVVGNLVGEVATFFDPNNFQNNVKNNGYDIKLSDLARQLKEAMQGFEDHFLCQVKKGGEVASFEILKRVEHISLLDKLEKPYHSITFTNWKGIFNEVDFGFGKPFNVGPSLGKLNHPCSNYVVLVDADRWGKGSIEAFIALEDKYMTLLESDHNFLAFTSKNS
ncbi:hypothetical protein CsatA_022547 [Cannabis sativa]